MLDYVDLFAGAGGWDVAARRLDLDVLGFEMWEPANKTREAEGLATRQGSVLEFNPLDFESRGLIASPPCQTFSAAGKGSGRAVIDSLVGAVADWQETLRGPCDERTALVLEPLRWVGDHYLDDRPYRNILLEQVPQVQPIWDAYALALDKLGYSTWTGVLSTEHFQVPQTRKRAILLASLDHVVVKPESKSLWSPSWNEALEIEDLEAVLESNYRGGPKPEGGKWQLGVRAFGQPSFTVTGKPHKIVYPDGTTRRLNPSQMGSLQTFPSDYQWQGKIGEQSLQAGNAVPVNLAHALLSLM